MTLSPLGSCHCFSCGAFLSARGLGVAAAAVDAAATSATRIMLRMRPPWIRSVRIAQSNLKAEWLLTSGDRTKSRQIARLDADGVAEVEQVEQIGDELQMMAPVARQELVEV